ncbi:hypothetical protein GCM10023185_07140 [Hymenobacter saemangeumensis]|uniref:DUF3619 family protein n=1 Tax=Hymenobacter saemangeumensis TaxID=1084522 RepID=A0ABP8I2E3_9BACT
MSKLPAFSGTCRAHELTAQAARRAAQAQYLEQWRRLSPDQLRAGAERNFGSMLLSMVAVLALALGYALHLKAQQAAPPAPTAQHYQEERTARGLESLTWRND